MALPFFFSEEISFTHHQHMLNEETSKHVVQVLRMQIGEQLQLTDGKGNIYTTEITDNNKKRCAVRFVSSSFQSAPEQTSTIAISLTKNAHRFEWFLEKATELGIDEIIPLICSRTEKQHFRYDRMKGILVSAMLQSQQSWLPVLHHPLKYNSFLPNHDGHQKFIAHCLEEEKPALNKLLHTSANKLICIGPEGDFTPDEIQQAIEMGFVPVALGKTRLRTETAGIVAATLLMMH